jgi:Tfp pilus assembly protein PilV
MKSKPRHSGFSLMETLLAVGTLAVGMVFVAGTFLAGVYLSTVSTERTIATVVADEAFAKIRLYGFDPNNADLKTDGYVAYDQLVTMPEAESFYPSTDTIVDKQYCWAAICRRVASDSHLVEFTVFVCRRMGTTTQYWTRVEDAGGSHLGQANVPHPLRVNLVKATADNEAIIQDAIADDDIDERTFVSGGDTLIDDEDGQIYRVLERYVDPPEKIRLDRTWVGTDLASAEGAWVWVVPKPKLGGRDPLVAIYQKVLRF